MRTVVKFWTRPWLFVRPCINCSSTFLPPVLLHFGDSALKALGFPPPLTCRIGLTMAASPQSSSQAVPPLDFEGDDTNVLQLIQTHQKNAVRLPPVVEIRTVLDRSRHGVLSTISQKHGSYPSGSMVDFACDEDGSPILAVSSLAAHTKDLAVNTKCSLLVARDPEDRADLVVTLHGDAICVAEQDKAAVRAAYLARHPTAYWVDFRDFHFMRIEPKILRYVSGIATALVASEEFCSEEYKAAKTDPIAQFSVPVTSHMNKDHAEDTKIIVQHSTSVPVDFAYMLDLDSLGFNVKAGYKGNNFKLRIAFPRRAADRKDVKTLIVEMLQAAKPKVN